VLEKENMKKIGSQLCWSVVLAATAFFGSSAKATLLLYEDFNYTAASNTTAQSGGTGWTGAWGTAAGDTSTIIAGSGLTYAGLPTAGNAANDNTFGSMGNTRTWSGAGLFGNGSELWLSALVNTSATGSDLRLFALTSSTVSAGGVGFSLAGSTIRATVNGSSFSSNITGTSGTTMLLVARIQFSNTVGADSVTAWLNPTIGATPPTGGSSISGDISSTFTTTPILGFRGGGSWMGIVDELRLGTTYGDVVGVAVPEPSTYSLFALAASGLVFCSHFRRRKV
jgi:hypothetical protein